MEVKSGWDGKICIWREEMSECLQVPSRNVMRLAIYHFPWSNLTTLLSIISLKTVGEIYFILDKSPDDIWLNAGELWKLLDKFRNRHGSVSYTKW